MVDPARLRLLLDAFLVRLPVGGGWWRRRDLGLPRGNRRLQRWSTAGCMQRRIALGDDYIPRWGVTWVPFQNGSGNVYSTEVPKVNYGAQELIVRRHAGKLTQVIFDSGSSYTYVPNEIYTNLISLGWMLKCLMHFILKGREIQRNSNTS